MSGEDKKYTGDDIDIAVRNAIAEERIARLEERFILHMEKEEATFKEMRQFFKEFKDSQISLHTELQQDLHTCRAEVKLEIMNEVSSKYATKSALNNVDNRIKTFRNRVFWTAAGAFMAISAIVYFADKLLPILIN